jgi:hypothetical protein
MKTGEGPPWRILFYQSPTGERVFLNDFKSQTPRVRAKFVSRLRFLAAAPRTDWKRPYYDDLKRDGKGLGEVRFETDKVQQRPLGFFSSTDSFSFVFWAIEKGQKLVPTSATDIGLRRKGELAHNPEQCHEFRLG